MAFPVDTPQTVRHPSCGSHSSFLLTREFKDSLAKQVLFLFEFCFHLLGSVSLTLSPASIDSSPVCGNFEWFLSFILIVNKILTFSGSDVLKLSL